MEWVQIRFDDDLGDRVKNAACSQGQSLGDFVRAALEDIVDQPARPMEGSFGYKGPRKPHALQVYLAHDFAYASGWEDLQSQLRAKGYELYECGGGLALRTVEGEKLCKASDLGQPYSKLMKRFGAPFAGHAHSHLIDRHLNQKVLPL